MDSEIDRPAPAIEGVAHTGELSPVPGWVGIVRVASAAAAASDPPASFLCRAQWGRLAWYNVRGSGPFVELLFKMPDGSTRTARFLVDSGGGSFLIVEPLA